MVSNEPYHNNSEVKIHHCFYLITKSTLAIIFQNNIFKMLPLSSSISIVYLLFNMSYSRHFNYSYFTYCSNSSLIYCF